MAHDGILPEYKEKIVRLVEALIPQAQIYLYGSRARGDFQPISDIDLAVDAPYTLKPQQILEVREVLRATLLPYAFDVINVQRASHEFLNEIKHDWIPWI